MIHPRWVRGSALAGSLLVLLLFSFQYPWSTPVPLGGDAPTHILVARYPFQAPLHRNVRAEGALLHSPYPISHALLAATKVLPLSWPTRFSVWMGVGHLLVGLLVGRLLWRLGGLSAAVIGMTLWSASTAEILPFFRSGTGPQLWSLLGPLLVAERLLAGSWRGALAGIVIAFFTHPATFAVTALSASLTLPTVLAGSRGGTTWARRRLVLAPTAGIAAVLLVTLFALGEKLPFTAIPAEGPYRTVSEFLGTRYGITLLLSPIGFAFLLGSPARRGGRLFLAVFGLLSLFLSFNQGLGIGVWEKRLSPYGVLAATIFGSFGLALLARTALPHLGTRAAVLGLALGAVLVSGWTNAARLYRVAGQERAAMTPAEHAAYEWIRTNTEPGAVVLTSDRRGRGAEWIQVVADRGLVGPLFPPATIERVILSGDADAAAASLPRSPATHLLSYRRFEDLPPTFRKSNGRFPIAYDNAEVLLLVLRGSNQ